MLPGVVNVSPLISPLALILVFSIPEAVIWLEKIPPLEKKKLSLLVSYLITPPLL